MDEADGLPVPVHRGRRARLVGAARRSRRSAQEQDRREPYAARDDARTLARRLAAAGGEAMAHRLRHGGRLFTFGNGGSATDADATADAVPHPPHGRSLPALSLVDDRAVLTALANDVGFDLVFSRQLIAHARPGDIAIGFSTSGGSANVLRAFEEARRRDMLTIGCRGYDGGAMAQCRRRRSLPGRAVRQRPSHPGGAGGAGPRAVVDRAARRSAEESARA